MRRVDVDSSSASGLLHALRAREPLELVLRAAPALPRLELLLAASEFPGVLLVSFDRDLATPLAELAGLSLAARFPEGARLDLRGALLAPLVARVGAAALRRIVAREGPIVPAGAVLSTPGFPGTHRSPLALALAEEALRAPRRDRREAMARELALFGLALSAADRVEGVRAFRERRRPEFDW